MTLLWMLAMGLGLFGWASINNRLSLMERRFQSMMSRLDRLERSGGGMPEIEERPVPMAPPVPAPIVSVPKAAAALKKTATIVRAPLPEPPDTPPRPVKAAPPPAPAPPPPPEKPAIPLAQRLEAAIAGKLPIWIGGLALVLSAFFLVRYSIEQGLLGPGVRCVLAALFGLVLLAASEATRFLPKVAEDERVAQALAGAGIASLYGTLYMASEMYVLIAPLTAFILLCVVTGAALALSLRRGPPTAIMGLIGGFATPYLASTGSGNLVALLVYLAMLMAGLFAVAVHRGWMWLALAATGGSIIWTVGLMASGMTGLDPELGLFIAAAAVAGTLVIPRSGGEKPSVRLLPMIAGFVQLLILAPSIDFALSGWVMYAVLAAAAIFLAWKDTRLVHGPLAALALVVVLLVSAFFQDKSLAPWAAIGATLLFGIPAYLIARRDGDGRWWTALALGASSGPLFAGHLAGNGLLTDPAWGGLFALSVLPPAHLAWRARGEGRTSGWPDWSLGGGSVLAGLFLLCASIFLFEDIWWASAALAIAAGLGWWANRTGDSFIRWASVGTIALGGLFLLGGCVAKMTVPEAILSDGAIPKVQALLALVIVPALLAGVCAWLHRDKRADQPLRWTALALTSGLALALVPMDWHPAALALLAGGAMAWEKSPVWLPRFGIEGLLTATAIALLTPLLNFGEILAGSIAGAVDHFALLPSSAVGVIGLVLPAGLIAAGLRFARAPLHPYGRRAAMGVVAVLLLAFLYMLVKQPLAIDSEAQFIRWGLVERALITQALMAGGWFLLRRKEDVGRWGIVLMAIGLARFVWFDLLVLNPIARTQMVGTIPILNAAVLHPLAIAAWLWLASQQGRLAKAAPWLRYASAAVTLIAVATAVRQASQGLFLDRPGIPLGENYGYSIALLALSLVWLLFGIKRRLGWLRLAGLTLLTLVTLKVFLVDASALSGLLRVLSFMGLGAALIGIGWAYGRLLKSEAAGEAKVEA